MGQRASHPQPNTTIQVIGAGLPRTGTASLSRALEILLNKPVYHCGTQSIHSPKAHLQNWITILDLWLSTTTTKKDTPSPDPELLNLLTTHLTGYAAITDSPAAQLLPELTHLYPTAKVILTTRDPETWEESLAQITQRLGSWFLPCILLPVSWTLLYFRYLALLGRLWRRVYGETRPTRVSYERHLEWVKSVVPEGRLVVFDVKEGWGPLCEALGVDVPADVPFPCVNDAEGVEEIVRERVRRGLVRWAVILAVGVVVGGFVFLLDGRS